MRHSKWIVWMVLGCLLFATAAEAAAGKSENKIGRFFRGLFRFPAKTTEKSVGVATDAATSGTRIGTKPVENVGRALTGSKEAAVGVVKDPITGAVKTSYEATKGAVMAVPEAAKESMQEHPGEEVKEHPGQ